MMQSVYKMRCCYNVAYCVRNEIFMRERDRMHLGKGPPHPLFFSIHVVAIITIIIDLSKLGWAWLKPSSAPLCPVPLRTEQGRRRSDFLLILLTSPVLKWGRRRGRRRRSSRICCTTLSSIVVNLRSFFPSFFPSFFLPDSLPSFLACVCVCVHPPTLCVDGVCFQLTLTYYALMFCTFKVITIFTLSYDLLVFHGVCNKKSFLAKANRRYHQATTIYALIQILWPWLSKSTHEREGERAVRIELGAKEDFLSLQEDKWPLQTRANVNCASKKNCFRILFFNGPPTQSSR